MNISNYSMNFTNTPLTTPKNYAKIVSEGSPVRTGMSFIFFSILADSAKGIRITTQIKERRNTQ
jgi:hypothetical protein